jgi:death on curing protein
MNERTADIRYLTLADVIALHEAVMQRTGAVVAVLRDEGLLESAVTRPRMAAYYKDADIRRQATLLAVAICQAQAFVDGNKRTAYACIETFLHLNGLRYAGDPVELAKQLEPIASRDDDLSSATARFETRPRDQVELV